MIRRALLLFAAILAIYTGIRAQTLEEVLSEHFKAIGMDKLQKVQSIKLTGTSFQMGMETPFVNIIARPERYYLEVPVGESLMIQAYDGNRGWMVAPWSGSLDPIDMTGEQLRGIKMQADMDGMLHNYEKKGLKTELKEKRKVEGRQAYVIRQINDAGDIFRHYIDAENYLLVRTATKITIEGTEREFVSSFSDYRDINGIMLAHVIQVDMGEQGYRRVTIDKAELNVDLDEKIFLKPDPASSKEGN